MASPFFSLIIQYFLLLLFPKMSPPKSRLNMIAGHLQGAINTRNVSTHAVISGSKYTSSFKAYYKTADGKLGSWFHDVPMGLENHVVNMVVEIPRWTNAKMEISKSLKLNPIVQDTKKGKLRYVDNIFPYHGYVHNYGAIPQTWEDCTVASDVMGLKGDNDPVDVCDIGSAAVSLGDIVRVKILGALALIDDGELDWKVIAINEADPRAGKMSGLSDVESLFPGVLDATRNWFRDYKIPTGKPANEFAFGGKYLDAEKAVEVVKETHLSWKKLVSGELKSEELPVVYNSELKGTPGHGEFDTKDLVGPEEEEGEIPSKVDEVFYLK